MDMLIGPGAVISLLGVTGLAYCVMKALRAKRAGLSDEAMRAELQKVVVINMAALGVSALGLALVIVGVLLG